LTETQLVLIRCALGHSRAQRISGHK